MYSLFLVYSQQHVLRTYFNSYVHPSYGLERIIEKYCTFILKCICTSHFRGLQIYKQTLLCVEQNRARPLPTTHQQIHCHPHRGSADYSQPHCDSFGSFLIRIGVLRMRNEVSALQGNQAVQHFCRPCVQQTETVFFKLLRSPGTDSKESIPPAFIAWARICKRLWSPGVASLCNLAGRYDK